MKKCVVILVVILTASLKAADAPVRFSRQQSIEVAHKVGIYIETQSNEKVEKALSNALVVEPKDEEFREHRTKMLRCVESIEEEEHPSQEIKNELANWAIRELAHKADEETQAKKREERYKLLASGIAGITTIVSVILPFVLDSACEEESSG